MKEYVLIFAFNEAYDKVLMIKKIKKPTHHIGLLNGVGGKVEGDEEYEDAARRELTEETGLDPVHNMLGFAMMTGGCGHDAWVVACFCTHLDFPDDFLLDTPGGPVKAYNVCDALTGKQCPTSHGWCPWPTSPAPIPISAGQTSVTTIR